MLEYSKLGGVKTDDFSDDSNMSMRYLPQGILALVSDVGFQLAILRCDLGTLSQHGRKLTPVGPALGRVYVWLGGYNGTEKVVKVRVYKSGCQLPIKGYKQRWLLYARDVFGIGEIRCKAEGPG